ncbi:MAG TPA: type II secretion system protein [Oligoflexia bacterium]|nr:type II secretion system protein [Oligoflexia bacterium]HMP27927.1 type II secretion system protein [Oligoflexia bacterium]
MNISWQKGFTLIEIMAALFILGLIAAAVALGVQTMTKLNYRATVKSGAIWAVVKTLENARGLEPHSISSGTENVTLNGITYSVERIVCPAATAALYCNTMDMWELQIRALYQGEEMYSLSTIYYGDLR